MGRLAHLSMDEPGTEQLYLTGNIIERRWVISRLFRENGHCGSRE